MKRLEIVAHDPPDARRIARASAIIDRGAVVAYPTDTIYALGCAIDAKKSALSLYRLKHMGKSQRLTLLCPDLSTASLYGHFSQPAFRLAQRIFPGPYTLVVPATREVPKLLLDKRRRAVGIRISSHLIVQALLRELGRPLLTTSAVDRDGHELTDADAVARTFGHGLDLLIDGGEASAGLSTVLSAFGDEIEVVREGIGVVE